MLFYHLFERELKRQVEEMGFRSRLMTRERKKEARRNGGVLFKADNNKEREKERRRRKKKECAGNSRWTFMRNAKGLMLRLIGRLSVTGSMIHRIITSIDNPSGFLLAFHVML